MDYSTSLKTLASIMGLVDVLYWIQAHHRHHHRHHISVSQDVPMLRCKEIRRFDTGIDVAHVQQQQQQ